MLKGGSQKERRGEGKEEWAVEKGESESGRVDVKQSELNSGAG